MHFQETIEADDEDFAIIVQIETPPAVENAKEIAAVDGVDALFVGPSDLSLLIGSFGEDDERLRDQIDSVLEIDALDHGWRQSERLRRLPRTLRGAIDETVTHCGEFRTGQVMKVCNQIVVGCAHQLVGRALLLAKRANADLETVLDTISGGRRLLDA